MLLNDFITIANYHYKMENEPVSCYKLSAGFSLTVREYFESGEVDMIRSTALTVGKERETRYFKSLDTVYKTLARAGYEGVLRVAFDEQ